MDGKTVCEHPGCADSNVSAVYRPSTPDTAPRAPPRSRSCLCPSPNLQPPAHSVMAAYGRSPGTIRTGPKHWHARPNPPG